VGTLQQRVLAEQLELALGNTSRASWLLLLGAPMATAALYNESNARLFVWCAGIMLLALVIGYLARRQLATGIEPNNVDVLIRRLVWASTLTGVSLGLLPWTTFDPTNVANTTFIVSATAALAALGMVTLTAISPAFVAYIIPQTLGLLVRQCSLHNFTFLLMGLAGVLYAAGLAVIARNGERSLRSTIMLRFENTELVEKLEREKAHAEQADQAKSRFLAAASHDLRQPIHAQGLYMDLLDHSRLSAHQHDLLRRIQDTWRASTEMLDTLLDFSRVEAGVVEPQRSAFHLQPLLAKLEGEFGPQADGKHLIFRARETVLAVESDPGLLELILRNLLSNAIRYTEQGGLLIGCRRRATHVWIDIWDTGIGMSPEQQENVFLEFYQVGNSERDRRKGLGLGLAITRGLAGALGHPLSLSSRQGRGSVFRLELPLADGTILTDRIEQEPAHMEPLGLRVLLVDDDETVLAGMRELFQQQWNCDCRTAESIEQAVSATERWFPELLVCDYRLRRQETGEELIRLLRDGLGYDLPAILITGDTAPQRLREANASGIPLLHKPVSAAQLYQRIATLMKPAA